jgi:hypothetical protein
MAYQSETQGVRDLCKGSLRDILAGLPHGVTNHNQLLVTPLMLQQYELPVLDKDTTSVSKKARDYDEYPLQLDGNGM